MVTPRLDHLLEAQHLLFIHIVSETKNSFYGVKDVVVSRWFHFSTVSALLKDKLFFYSNKNIHQYDTNFVVCM